MKRTVLALFLLFCFTLSVSAYTDEVNGFKNQFKEYRPSYFLLSNHVSKLQVSFKIQVIENWDLYFAYTQLMFWALWEDSQPFKDLNYNPELFYRFNISPEFQSGLDLGIVEHESNGRPGNESVGWNRTYLRYFHTIPIGFETKMYANLKVWVPYIFDSTSMDVDRYRGLWEINLTLVNFLGPSFDRNDLTFRFYGGGPSKVNPLEGGQELTYRFNRAIFKELQPIITMQVFHGFAEGLLEYKKETFTFRVGLGF